MDSILKVLQDLQAILEHKRKSLAGVVGNQATAAAQERTKIKIKELDQRIDEVKNCISLRMSEIAEKDRVDLNHNPEF